ncbi:MAG: LapA family protein [Desulfuromonadales bacterium]|nr:LapA family protein [Desulfuromonadales bacterium]
MKFALIAAIIVSAVMAYFAVENSQQTQVTFLGWYFDAPLVIILLLSFGAGVVATFLATLPGTFRKSREISNLKAQAIVDAAKITALEKETQLHAAQIKEPNNVVRL